MTQFFKGSQQRLGLHLSQDWPDRTAVPHWPPVYWTSARLTRMRIMRPGAQDQRTDAQAAHLSTASVHKPLRCLIGDDINAYLKEEQHGKSVLTALTHLRVAWKSQSRSPGVTR